MYRTDTGSCTELVLAMYTERVSVVPNGYCTMYRRGTASVLKLYVPKEALFCTEQVMYRNGTPYVPKGTCTEEAPTRKNYRQKRKGKGKKEKD